MTTPPDTGSVVFEITVDGCALKIGLTLDGTGGHHLTLAAVEALHEPFMTLVRQLLVDPPAPTVAAPAPAPGRPPTPHPSRQNRKRRRPSTPAPSSSTVA